MRLRPAWIAMLILAASIARMPAEQHRIYPLPEERGAAGILQALGRLPVYGHVLYITAHPDDENAGTLAWLARSAHLRTAVFVLTRGDGGQNLLGDEKYEAMGLLRTGEMLEACRLYGAEAYFSTAYEFGFSRSADETMGKWGRETTLEEIVRFIRRFRPAVIFSAFRNDGSGGHGHHQTAGILSREAFRAAADPARFPEHMKQGLLPWQAKSFYTGSMGGSGSGALAIPSGDFDMVLGRTYRMIGAEGYSKHRSQGNGARISTSLRGSDRFQLEDAVPGVDAGTEQKPFGEIDFTIPAILELAGKEKQKVEFLRDDLGNVQLEAQDAARSFRPFQPWNGTAPILRALGIIRNDIAEIRNGSIVRACQRTPARRSGRKKGGL